MDRQQEAQSNTSKREAAETKNQREARTWSCLLSRTFTADPQKVWNETVANEVNDAIRVQWSAMECHGVQWS